MNDWKRTMLGMNEYKFWKYFIIKKVYLLSNNLEWDVALQSTTL